MSDDIFIGNVAVGIVPSAAGLAEKIRAQVVPSASKIGGEFGGRFNEGLTSRIGDVMGRWSNDQSLRAGQGGEQAATRYADSFKAKIDATLRNLPPVEIKANATEADRTVQKLRTQLEELQSKTIGVDLSGSEAMATLDKIKAEMVNIRDHPAKAEIRASVMNWQESLDKVDELRAIASKPIIQKIEVTTAGGGAATAVARKDAEREGEAAGASWGARFMGKVRSSVGSEGMFGGLHKGVAAEGTKDAEAYSGRFSGVMSSAFGPTGLVVAGVIGGLFLMAKSAGNFEEGLTRLNTAAGESAKALPMVGEGIKQIASDTGTSLDQLNKGAFMIESAGFHGAAALKVLSAAAEGAKISGADLGTVGNATTTVMNDFGLKAMDATKAVSGLNAIVSHGKTTLEDLASASSRYLPTAAALHISFGDVGGAMATLTGEGISAKLAAMGLNSTMLALAASSPAAKKEMEAMGLSSQKVANDLTHRGLTFALNEVAQAALNAGPKGSAPYIAAMKEMVGGNRGLQVALGLTGEHMKTTAANVGAVGKAFDQGGRHVSGWAKTQEDFNFKFSRLKESLLVVAVTIGEKVMPAFASIMDFIHGHLPLIGILALAIGVALVAAFAAATIAAISFWTAATAGIALAVALLVAVVIRYHKEILNFIVSTWHKVANFVKEWWPFFLAIVLGPLGALLGAVIKYHTAILHFIESVWRDVAEFFIAIWNKILHFIKDWWPVLLAVMTGGLLIMVGLVVKFHTQIWNFIQSIWHKIMNVIHDAVDWISHLINDALNWIRGIWERSWSWVRDKVQSIWNDVKSIIHAATDWIQTRLSGVWGAIKGTAERMWDDIKKGIKSVWDGIKQVVKDPINVVIRFINTMVGGVDAVLSAIGIKGHGQHGGPIGSIPQLATGGRITQGTTETADDVLIRVSKHETVLSAAHTRILEPALRALNVPGFAKGGKVDLSAYRNPIPRGVTPERIDMGVDFSGSGPILAMGAGRVIETSGGGWPGGPFMSYRLLDGPLAGMGVYVAENIRPVVRTGQTVKPGQHIADMFNGGTGIETGFADSSGFRPLSQTPDAGSITGANLPPNGATQVGELFDELLVALGAPRAPNFGLPSGGKIPGVLSKQFPSGGSLLTVLAQLAKAGAGALGGIVVNTITDLLQVAGIPSPVLDAIKMLTGLKAPGGSGSGWIKQLTGGMGKFIVGKVGGWLRGKAFSLLKHVFASQIAAAGSGGSGTGPPGGTGGTMMQNGIEIYKYLRANLFGGNKIAAAGATASIWGESLWNPFASGGGGRGLIGWTPPSLLSDADFKGGLRTQLPAILKFVFTNGDSGVISRMLQATSVSQAAWEWGKGVERFGVPDVHNQGLAIASQIMNRYASGTRGAAPGWAWVGEQGPELVRMHGGEMVLNNRQSMAVAGNTLRGYASGTGEIVAFGASATQGIGATAGHTYEDDLSRLLHGRRVFNAGISGNQLLHTAGSMAGFERFARIIGPHGASIVIVWQGNNDISNGEGAGNITAAYKALVAFAHAYGIRVVGATLQPTGWGKGSIPENARQSVNRFIRGSHLFDRVADLDAVLRDPNHLNVMRQAYRSDKGAAHPGDAGYSAIAGYLSGVINGLPDNKYLGLADQKRVATLRREHSKSWLIGTAASVRAEMAKAALSGNVGNYMGKYGYYKDIESAIRGYASGTRGAARGWAMVGERGMELVNLHGGEEILSHEQSLAALSRMPGISGYASGTMNSGSDSGLRTSEAESLKSALRDVEKLLKANVDATRRVGGDVASSMNGKVARPAGNRGVYNNGM
jgi:TP901 family phage tail tape measure protein